jgi:hypothetical protein
MTFDQEATARIRELLARNQEGSLTAFEQDELQRYLRVGQLLDLLHAKASLALQASNSETNAWGALSLRS